MDLEKKFNEKDKESVVMFLNFVAQKAEFKLDTKDIILYHKLLSFMQSQLLPKINDNILEVKSITEESKEE